ncbi:MAG: NAD(P)-dependent alcohol dehydrogenase [Deltaproteobacteria bacterium]|nr:NAD(P)-dependent alcohol dehydrogenase [Deltaproteobacteria bacterium]
MRAVYFEKFGGIDNLRFSADVEKPVPGDDEVLVRVRATSLNHGDLHLLKGESLILRIMARSMFRSNVKILGLDAAGTIEAVGRNVKSFKAGDNVFGDVGDARLGGLGEYVAANERVFALKPEYMPFTDAGALPVAALTALQGLRDKGGIKNGHKVLVNGASGNVGHMAVQLAKHFGAEVTATCSASKAEFVKSLGADRVIDYKTEDVTKSSLKFDIILDLALSGFFARYKAVLGEKGVYVLVGSVCVSNTFISAPLMFLMSRKGGQKFEFFISKGSRDDLGCVSGFYKDGILKPHIDKIYKIEDAIEAFRYFDEGRARGKVVITVD